MAKYARKADRPTVDAIKVKWVSAPEGVKLRNGDWLIRDSAGYTTYCDDDYFQQKYESVE